MKYTTKNPPLIDAIGFEDLVAHGIAQGVPLIDGMPWSFDYQGHHVTHENNNCYLIGACRLERGQFLVTGPGELTRALWPVELHENYDTVPNP